ncbi:hypothetical protein [Gimesia aquarii]|uniref:Phage P2 GpU n=1 Tax=Gimesia aquarii TaxID=2527964 RepID=A0A517VRA8_9PLAN|nr:hypothetical protein [Gimesia aquarii]QDT95556.1 hypothetical protein V144x_10010 [Gimesia aquarii]
MSAPIVHAGFQFPGIHQELIFGSPEANFQINEVFGLDGITLLDGGVGARQINVQMWLYDSYSTTGQLNTKLRAIKDHILNKGDLIDSQGTFFDDVVFLNFDHIQGPLYDSDIGWWKRIRLNFLELTP